MRLGIRIVFGLSLLSLAVQAQNRCSRDSDCQNGQVCTQNVCELPPPPPPPPPDEPGTLPPAPDTPSYGEPGRAKPKPQKQTHDGFYLRLDLGLGYLTSSASQGGVDASIYGGAGEFGFAIGGALFPHHILAFHLWGVGVSNPTVSANGASGTASSDYSIFAFGPQYTYYAPSDLFFSITPGLSQLSAGDSQSDVGFGLQAALGKEWKVSEKWGLGVVGELTLGVNQDSTPNPPTFTTFAFTVAFSATYN